MKYKVSDDLIFVSRFLNLSHEKLADQIGIPFETFSRLINNRLEPSEDLLEKIYSFIYKKGLELNKVKCEVYQKKYLALFFHGSKNEIEGEISLDYSRSNVDFGPGFYMGDNYEQSLDFVASTKQGSIYIAKVDMSNLKILNLDIGLDWMLIIAFHRQKLERFNSSKEYQRIKQLISEYDVIVGPIADNRMFTTIEDFTNSSINSEQAIHALKDLSLGKQIVFKTKKAIKRIELIERLYVCADEKHKAEKHKIQKIIDADTYIRDAYEAHVHEGKYIKEVFDNERND